VYYRDGYRCVYCGIGVEDGARLTLDHVRSRDRGGNHSPRNVITCCCSCNSAKQGISMRAWLRLLREKGVETDGILARIRRLTRTPLLRDAPRNLFHEAHSQRRRAKK